ncbi:aspartate--tRNA ligase [Spirochaeta cellobiosiphila]|uniref:aspartate--tRNA ligase n=1 Tax=Spirochaeta cellobiosiphila TaxID=504483 RepID=UPI00048E73B5|nr:aspartate--tRNA ligase [Spirochaeta cellobiosiphila]
MKRTVTCGELSAANAGQEVVLNGWVHRHRDHGGILFINLRDRYGITQTVVDQDAPAELMAKAEALKMEYCVAIKGIVQKRPDEMVNKDMSTGSIEVVVKELEVLSTSEVLPFMIDGDSEANENLRLKYRYLDLRREEMQRNIKLRADVSYRTREYLTQQGFLELETPTLIKSTPEGARDFLVPSRLQAGKFYALPQSPQLYKQLLMVSGFDKYFQIARCYRDEDARGDRQLEFTQIDMEMSFVSAEDVYSMTEGMMKHIFKTTLNVDLNLPFKRLSYHDAMNTYGSDKPELRFDMPFKDFAEFVPGSEFGVFKSVLDEGGAVKALKVPGCAHYSRKMITDLENIAKHYGAKGMAWMKVTAEGLEGGVSKFFTEQSQQIISYLEAQEGDLILFGAGPWSTACTSLGAVRSQLGKDLNLCDPNKFEFCWIVDFPLFEWNEEENKWDPCHHMFTMPQSQYLETMEQDPGEVKGDLYDLVLNGYELASGSIRCHDSNVQKRIFDIVGFDPEEAKERFGFLLDSFQYGPPPHGGIAPGLDRLVMIMCGEDSIREVIPFPKNSVGVSPMDDAPAVVDDQQMKDLHLVLNLPEDKE